MNENFEIDDGFKFGACARHMKPNFHTNVHNSQEWTDDDWNVLTFLMRHKTGGEMPGMVQQEAITDFQERDFDAYAVGISHTGERKRHTS